MIVMVLIWTPWTIKGTPWKLNKWIPKNEVCKRYLTYGVILGYTYINQGGKQFERLFTNEVCLRFCFLRWLEQVTQKYAIAWWWFTMWLNVDQQRLSFNRHSRVKLYRWSILKYLTRCWSNNPFENYARQILSSPQEIAVKTKKNMCNHYLEHQRKRSKICPVILQDLFAQHPYQSGQIIIFHQPRFPWNSREFPLLNHHLGWVVWGRYNLTRSIRSCEVAIVLAFLEEKNPNSLTKLGEISPTKVHDEILPRNPWKKKSRNSNPNTSCDFYQKKDFQKFWSPKLWSKTVFFCSTNIQKHHLDLPNVLGQKYKNIHQMVV